jgi:CheY-like chemotaxis protein
LSGCVRRGFYDPEGRIAMSHQVLVVDDDRDIVTGVSMRLRAAGYRTLAAYDGQQGLAAAICYRPDAILLDVRMPTMDGITALGKLKDHPDTRDIPVIVLSASIMDQQIALDAGARSFVQKPYSREDLLNVLAVAINSRQSVAS